MSAKTRSLTLTGAARHRTRTSRTAMALHTCPPPQRAQTPASRLHTLALTIISIAYRTLIPLPPCCTPSTSRIALTPPLHIQTAIPSPTSLHSHTPTASRRAPGPHRRRHHIPSPHTHQAHRRRHTSTTMMPTPTTTAATWCPNRGWATAITVGSCIPTLPESSRTTMGALTRLRRRWLPSRTSGTYAGTIAILAHIPTRICITPTFPVITSITTIP